ncbi:hypothetical protein HD806DRAFT_524175 [Xylariaceae sp. AK1471]|nr:hypothetical protein HD806DRAFT_524175 [Xylariaceae sp. AK1471]
MSLRENSRKPLLKKDKLAYPTFPPPAFWDNLSNIPLTKNATTQYLGRPNLTELDRIRRFARLGGPDLSNLRGVGYTCGIVLSSGMSIAQSNLGRRKCGEAFATSTKSIGPLCMSLSCLLDEEFWQFKQADAYASKEPQVMFTVIPFIEGKVRDGKCVSGQIPFENRDSLTDGSLVPGSPDRYYGARPEQLDQQVQTQLGGHIVPSTQHDLPIAPNFFLNTKGPDGSTAVAQRQACYDGALGARGINSLQIYGDPESDPDNKAYTLTSTYQNGHLRIYVSYLLPARPGMSREYVMTQISSWSLINNVSTFRQGIAAYRNARDWAKKVRDEAITKANETAARNSFKYELW